MGDPEHLTIIIIGDGNVGKTSLLVRFAYGKFDADSRTPTVLTRNIVPAQFNGKAYNIELIDTGGQEEFKRIAEQYYHKADVFLVGFDVSSKTSLKNVSEVRQRQRRNCRLKFLFNCSVVYRSPKYG